MDITQENEVGFTVNLLEHFLEFESRKTGVEHIQATEDEDSGICAVVFHTHIISVLYGLTGVFLNVQRAFNLHLPLEVGHEKTEYESVDSIEDSIKS